MNRIQRFALLLACSVVGSAPPQSIAIEKAGVQKLAEDVYVRLGDANSGTVSNSGFVVLENGVLVYDTHFTPEAGQSLLQEIHKITAKPVKYVVNSHFHPDHTHGNQAFSNSPLVLSSASARRDMLEKDLPIMNRTLEAAREQLERMKKDFPSVRDPLQQADIRAQISQRQKFLDQLARQRIVSPVVGVEDTLELNEGTMRLQFFYPGRGHTDGDLVLYLPAEKIAFVGDLFFNTSLPNTQDAYLLDWIRTLDKLLELDAVSFVPGHGSVGAREQVKVFRQYLEDLKGWVEPAVQRGDSMEQVLHDVQLPEKYSTFGFQNFFTANIQRMFVELKGR